MISLHVWDEVNYVNTFRKEGQLSPVCNGGIMTPPKSTEKPPGKTLRKLTEQTTWN